MFRLWFLCPTPHPSSSSMFCTQFVEEGAGDEAFQPLLSIFSLESVTSLLENVQFPLNVKEITFLVFYLLLFLLADIKCGIMNI